MSSISIHAPFLEKCPDVKLVQSTVTSGIVPYETACLGGQMLYDDAKILKQCPFPKTRESCVNSLRANAIVDSLTKNPNISKCGSFDLLADDLNFCTKEMEQLTKGLMSDSAVAQSIYQSCNFQYM